MKKIISTVMLLILSTSCSQSDLPDFNKIEGPRVIGIIADKPEANPGDTINITPVISDLQAISGLEDTIQVCIDPGVAIGASATCEGNPTKVVVQNHRTLTLPGVAENWTGLADAASFIIPSANIIFYQRSEADKYNGVNYLVEYILYSPSGEIIKAIKRIVVTDPSKIVKNQNPTITDIFANSISMTTLPISTKVNLTSDLNGTSAEAYSLKDNQGNLKNYMEVLTLTWFITDGETKYYRSEVAGSSTVPDEYTGPESAPTGRSAYILAVARDNRGGIAVIKRKLN